MKKITRTALLIGVLCTMAASCQKENQVEPAQTTTVATVQTTSYSVNGMAYSTTEDRAALLERLMALAREGNTVTLFHDGNSNGIHSTKEKVVFTTSDPNEAADWADQMYEQGYSVTITYNKKTGIYTCIAIK